MTSRWTGAGPTFHARPGTHRGGQEGLQEARLASQQRPGLPILTQSPTPQQGRCHHGPRRPADPDGARISSGLIPGPSVPALLTCEVTFLVSS